MFEDGDVIVEKVLPKVKKIKIMPVLDELTERDQNEASGVYYKRKIFKISESGYGSLVVAGMITGCGILQVSGVYCFTTQEKLNEIFDLVTKTYSQAAYIVCTLGPRSRWSHKEDSEKLLLNYGFKLLDTFNNWHDTSTPDGHLQRVFGYYIDRTEERKPKVKPKKNEKDNSLV